MVVDLGAMASKDSLDAAEAQHLGHLESPKSLHSPELIAAIVVNVEKVLDIPNRYAGE